MDLYDISKNVKFIESSHQYFLGDKELTSVSKVIDSIKPKFDEFGHIARACAKRDNLTVEQVKEKWNKAKTDGLTRGNSFHRQAEHYIKTGKILDDDYKDVIEQFAQIKFTGKLYSEVRLYDPNFGIAGTADLVELYKDNTVGLFDFKSNKKILNKSKYGTKLLYPVEELDDCEIVNYSFQLGIYKHMLQLHGFKVNHITLYHINPETRKIDIYKMLDLDKEVQTLLKYWKMMKDW